MTLLHGFALTFLAGLTVGFSMWSIKWARIWKWENFWLVYTLVSLIIVPLALAFWLLPHLGEVYASLTFHEVLKPLVFGALWGFAQLGVGICIHKLGLAVSGAIVNGIGAGVGTVVPLVLLHREMLLQASGLLVMAGTMVMLLGVALCGWSGFWREDEARRQGRGAGFSEKESAMTQEASTRAGYLLNVAIAVGAGVLASLLNIALAYGGDIMEKVRAHGGAASWAPFAVWPIALLGGSVVNFGYSIYLLSKNHTWGNFSGGIREVFNPVLAACMWMGGIALYSSGTTFLGVLGVSIGFALYMTTVVLSGQLAAVSTGEWRQMQPRIYRLFAAGIACLFIAVVAIAAANYFSQ